MAELSETFVNHSAEILGEGLTTSHMLKICNAFAVEYNVDIPHTKYPYTANNKRAALAQNIMKFDEPQRYQLIKELCDHSDNAARPEARKVKLQLMTRYGHLSDEALGAAVNEELIEQTKHWLDLFIDASGLYHQALEKHKNNVFQRNVLDDLRLSLELLVQRILNNEKSLENQLPLVGDFVKTRGGSPEFVNMFVKLLDYYTKYQNNYVKHDDAVIEEEIEFIFELTSSFMKHLVRLSQR